jgi:2-deoxy-D-gluconate 3-dehydrogenase
MTLDSMFDISGKRALVTGGSRGIGFTLACALYNAGVKVAVTGSSETIHVAAGKIGAPERVQGFVGNFQDSAAVENCFQKSLDFLGGVDILVNNAGTQIRYPCEDFPLEDFEKVIHVNLISAFHMAQLAGREMLAHGKGKIINIASMLSFFGGFHVPAYSASKGGIAQITKALSNEWAGRGINVNAIAPGYLATDNTAAIRADPVRNQEILSRIPAGRWGTPRDLEGTLIFLASSASDYLSGAILPVDGGFMGR